MKVSVLCSKCNNSRLVSKPEAFAAAKRPCRSCAKKQDIGGQVFGRLVALKPTLTTPDRKHQYWLCQCTCSKMVEVRRNNLLNSHTASCGCLAKETSSAKLKAVRRAQTTPDKHPQYKGGPIANLYRSQIKGATKRQMDWELTFSQFEALVNSACFYCNAPPTRKDCKGLLRNGVDRVNNALGYVPENCVPCCWTCNDAKGRMAGKDYIEHCWRVSNNCYRQDNPEEDFEWEDVA